MADFGVETGLVSQGLRTLEAAKYCSSHLSALVLVCKSICLSWTKIKYTVELNEREFITMTDLCLQVKLSPLLHTLQLLWIIETSEVPRGISVPFEGQKTWTQRHTTKII